MKNLILLLILIISSCYSKPYKIGTEPYLIEPPTKDCTNIMVRMKVLYGLNKGYEGMDFARVIAVDKVDGTMSVTILPPQGASEFPLKDDLNQKYKLRFVACSENSQSILYGANFNSSTCAYASPQNLVGGLDSITYESHLLSQGYKTPIPGCEGSSDCWTTVHNTRDPYSNAGMLLPTTIMFIASEISNPNNSYIIAIGDSPYRSCYFTNIRN